MPSLVEELQRKALDSNTRVADLLRMAKMIAVKLDLPELEKWVNVELNGYPSGIEVPEYRLIVGQLKAHNQFHGWIPVIFPDNKLEQTVSRQRISDSVSELDGLIAKAREQELMVSLSSELKTLLINFFHHNSDYAVVVPPCAIEGILDAIRNALLEWSLKLEKSGIRGDGMSFSSDERKKAHEAQVTYNIGSIETFTGNMGSGSGNFSVEGNTVNVTSKAAIESLVRKIRDNEAQLGLEPESARELHQALDGLQTEIKATEPSAKRINGFLASVGGIAEKAAGSLVAQGILYELAKLMHLATHQ
jgi:hypothetical protein